VAQLLLHVASSRAISVARVQFLLRACNFCCAQGAAPPTASRCVAATAAVENVVEMLVGTEQHANGFTVSPRGLTHAPQVTPITDGDGARVKGGAGSFMKGAEEKSLSLPNLEKVTLNPSLRLSSFLEPLPLLNQRAAAAATLTPRLRCARKMRPHCRAA
jgi:hypothetical protein